MIRLLLCFAFVCLFQSFGLSEDALHLVNEQRAIRGLGPLVHDEVLNLGAEHKAVKAAEASYKGHLGGSKYGANYEGVGYDRRRLFRACYLYTAKAGSRVGAAIVKGRDGFNYCCLLVKSESRLDPHPR